MKLPEQKQILLDSISADLQRIDGVKAIVLGGSHATGLANEDSDLDIGIYYSEKEPFDIERIRTVAKNYAANEEPTVTGFYEWGPWVNGGAWISTAKGEVDFIYKNIDQVERTIQNATEGIWENHYEQQPPYGFSSIIFLGETQACIPLYDPDAVLQTLKQRVGTYPPKLKQSVVQQSLWSAEFTIWQAAKLAASSDVYATVGCITRAVHSILTALFAINEIYPLGDKKALSILESAVNKPSDFTEKINRVLSCQKDTLKVNVEQLSSLFKETAGLANGMYRPYYNL